MIFFSYRASLLHYTAPLLALAILAGMFWMPRTAYADELAWARALGNNSSEEAIGIGVDSQGNVYATGTFDGVVDFDPGPGVFNLSSGNHRSVYVVKLDTNGNLLWAKRITGSDTVKVEGIAVAPNGNIHLTGSFQDSVDLDPGPGVAGFGSQGDDGSEDIFLVKLDANGAFLWGLTAGSSASDAGGAVAVDGQGNVYVTGSFEDIVDFDPGPSAHYLTSEGEDDIFVAKYDPNGAFLWAHSMSGDDDGEGSALAVHRNGSIVVAGTFEGRFDFDPGFTGSEFRSAGDQDIFVVGLTSGGLWQWTTIIGGPDEERGPDVALDAAGNTYVTGSFERTADFDRQTDPQLSGDKLTSYGDKDIFLARYGPNGNFLWAHAIGSGRSDEGEAVTVDAQGNVYLTGNFEMTVDFDPDPGQKRFTATGEDDIFVARFSSAGALRSAEAISGPMDEESRDIAVDGGGNVYITGDFQGKVGLTLREAQPAASTALEYDVLEYDVVVAKLTRPIPQNIRPSSFFPFVGR